jgi:SAM-dependent methyltransferase
MENYPQPQIQDTGAVRAFFEGWNLYRRIVDHDYLHHLSAREALGSWLDGFGRPFSFLDLGCGDAAFSSELLRGKPLLSYTGVDLSTVALNLAEQSTRDLKVPCNLVEGDFLANLSHLPGSYDIIYIGLSLHHLHQAQKASFFGELRAKLPPGGTLLVFDPILKPGESRESYMERWVDHARRFWKALTAEEVEKAVEHVTTSDYPEEVSELNRMALAAGFRPAEILLRDRTEFYALMLFRAE